PVSLRLRRMEYSTRSFASLSNRSSCIGAYHSTSPAGCNCSRFPVGSAALTYRYPARRSQSGGYSITCFEQVSPRMRHQNRRERAGNVFALPSAGLAFQRRCDERPLHSLLAQGCTCCKQRHRLASTTEAQRG